MPRHTIFKVGDFYGKLEITSILPMGNGKHVKLECKCHFCGRTTTLNGVNIQRRRSCGCQQHNSTIWKSAGPKTMPWQLPKGLSAKNSLLFSYKREAKRRDLVFELTEEQFSKLVVGNCVYCGGQLTSIKKGIGKTSGDFLYTGIDRIDSNKGYIIDNCVSCCWRCNSMKNKYSINEFKDHIFKICQHMNWIQDLKFLFEDNL